ncbi:hypothetical protein Sp245p_16620 (plasmid) [Azospirillum baldaniorum]|uniref:Uncharacterized protein n=1 Tax=Azospirillum baldaniorum TaxID=1064539 RepID=A0A9P1JTZ3_9PROT|nr:hypothetical protein Sp245p_16620 [Azospirillum baldaniorum]CCC99766.1 protein of unknown function [Azospirillum baldaniorum]
MYVGRTNSGGTGKTTAGPACAEPAVSFGSETKSPYSLLVVVVRSVVVEPPVGGVVRLELP